MRDFRYKDDDDDMTDRSQAQALRDLIQKPPRLWEPKDILPVQGLEPWDPA